MDTQCPHCRKTFAITKKQRQGKKKEVVCHFCNEKFKPEPLGTEKSPSLLNQEVEAEYIPKTDTSPQPTHSNKVVDQGYPANIGNLLKKNDASVDTEAPEMSDPEAEQLPWETQNKPKSFNWLIGIALGSMLLLGQVAYFEGNKWSQNPQYRPKLEMLCSRLGCLLKEYKNLAEFVVLTSSFTPTADGMMTFKAVIHNQAMFKQRLPNIKLALLDYNEQLIAQRLLTPQEYLQGKQPIKNVIGPDETISAVVVIAKTKTPIGGFHFDLID